MLYSLAMLAVVLGCGRTSTRPPQEYSIADSTVDYAAATESHGETVQFQFRRAIGAGILRDVGPLAVSQGGVLAVYETATCSIAFLTITSDELLGRFGRCGEGPEEFRSVNTMAFDGDTLWAADRRRGSLVVVSPEFTFVRRIVPASRAEGVLLNLARIHMVGPGLLSTDAVEPRARSTFLTGILERETGRILLRLGRIQPRLIANPDIANATAFSCGAPRPEGGVVVISNIWQFETVAYSTDGVLLWQSFTPLDWMGSTGVGADELPTGFPAPPLCGDSLILLRASEIEDGDTPTGLMGRGYLEFRNYRGEPRFAVDVPARHPQLWERRAATRGNLWLFADDFDEDPTVLVYEHGVRKPGDPELVLAPPENIP